jgi:hypothetical protein
VIQLSVGATLEEMTDKHGGHAPTTCPARLRCGWSEHGRKHFPHPGLTPAHTVHGPAKYLPGTTREEIRALETGTVEAPDSSLRLPPGKWEYVRQVVQVIGWDRGQDAAHSLAECSGGTSGGRAFHGRPMASDNPKLSAKREPEGNP